MLHYKYIYIEAITIFLKNTQDSINISTIYIPPASSINTTLINNIKKTADNIIITGDLSAKHTDFNCTKMGRWGIALKKALYNAGLFIADSSIPTYTDSRTNTRDIIDYIISSPSIFDNIQNLTLNNDLSSDHSEILFYFLTNFNKSILLPLKLSYIIKLSGTQLTLLFLINLLSYRIRFLILHFLKTLIPINIINNAATILTYTILNIYNNLSEKTIKPNTSIPFAIQLLVKQKRKIEWTFIKTRNPFLKTALNAISKKIEKQIKNHRTTDIQTRIKSPVKQRSEELEKSKERNGLSQQRKFIPGHKEWYINHKDRWR